MSSSQPIVLVEDNEDDVFFMRHAFKEAGISNPLRVLKDGQEAIEFLGGTGRYAGAADSPSPALVLLDLQLPLMRGLDVLKWLRAQPSLFDLIVIILSSSSEPSDIAEAYKRGANSYLVKPASLGELVQMVTRLKTYWLETNLLPPR